MSATTRKSWMLGTGTKPPTQKNELSINKEYIQTPRETPTVNRQYVKNIKDIVLLATVNYARTNLANNLAGVIFSSTGFIITLDLTGVSLQEDGLSFRNTNPTTGVGVISTNPVYDLDTENEFLVITTFKFTGFGGSWPPGICSLSDRASISFNTTTSLIIQANSRAYIHSGLPNLFDSKEHTLVILVRREPDFNTRYIFIDGIEYGYIKQADTATYPPTSMNYFFNTSTYANRYPASGSIYKLFACLRSKDILMPEVAKELSAKPWKLFSTTTKNLITTKPKTEDIYPVTRTVSSPAPSLILSKKAAKQPQGPVILNRAFAEKAEIVFTGNRCKTTYGVYADNLVETGPILESRGTVISTVGVAGQAIGPNTIGGSGFTFTNTPGTAGLVSSGLIVIEFPNTIMDGGSLYNNCWSAADFPDDPGLSVTCFNTGTILFELQNTGEQVYSLNGLVAKGLNVVTWSYDGYKFIANINNKSGGITSVYQPFNTVRPIGAFGDYYDLGTTYGAGAKKYYLGAIWSRAMSTSELYQLHQNPWQILQPVNRRIITGV